MPVLLFGLLALIAVPMTAIWCSARHQGWGMGIGAVAFGLAAFIPGWIAIVLPVYLIALCCAGAGMAGSRALRTGVVVWGGLCVALLGFVTVHMVQRTAQFAALRERYPMESLAERLAYEPKADPAEPSPELSSEIRAALDVQEVRSLRSFFRVLALRAVHDGARADFASAVGFGVGRMRPIQPKDAEYEPPPPTPIPPYVPADDATPAPEVPLAADAPANAPADLPPALQEETPTGVDRWREFHRAGVYGFLQPESMGYVESPQRVAGFEPHAMRPWSAEAQTHALRSEWQMVRLELVSLLKHQPPRAYVSKNLPRMDELRAAPTRPLDAFEGPALQKLGAQDLVLTEQPGLLRMLGSIRASRSCLDCHQVREGTLLGAFTYEFRSPRPTPVATPPSNLPRT